MLKRLSLATLTVIAALGFASPMLAQSRAAVTGADLDAAVATQTVPRGEAVRTLLSSEQVQKVAGLMGINTDDLAARVAALDGTALNQLADRAGVDDEDLAGGNTIVISTTAVIIILLILILLTD